MPYQIVKRDDKWAIVNTDRNETVGSSDTKEDAEASVRARQAAEHGVKFCDDHIKYMKLTKDNVDSFAQQFGLSYSDAYRMFELNECDMLSVYEDEEEIKWVTINGRAVPIRDGKPDFSGKTKWRGEEKDTRAGAGTVERDTVDLLRKRLVEGHLKPGEKASIERRMEEASKAIIEGTATKRNKDE